MKLKALLFDVDGTLAETEKDLKRVAFNRAFARLQLAYFWDEDLYGELVKVAGSSERLRFYFARYCEMSAAECEPLIDSILQQQNAALIEMLDEVKIFPSSGILRLFDEAHAANTATGIVTAGSRASLPLVELLLGTKRFQRLSVIVSGDDVRCKKPHPEAYHLALERLAIDARGAIAIEDSANGLAAAKAASLPCLIVRSFYSRDHDFSQADLVVEALGDENAPTKLLSNPHDLACNSYITLADISQLHAVSSLSKEGRSR